MKTNFRKLLNKNNILYVLSVILIFIIGYNIFVYLKKIGLNGLNLNEGLIPIVTNRPTNVSRQKFVIIQPVSTPNVGREWLNINEVTLYDPNDMVIPYTAASSNGIFYGQSWHDVPKLYDRNNDTTYIGGQPGTILSLTPINPKKIISKIVIKNRQDCCQDRLKAFDLVLTEANNDNTLASFPLISAEGLYDETKKYTHTFTMPEYDNEIANIIIGHSI
jgi:hypothetical protein